MQINPAISLFYGIPKVGKTKLLSELDDCLTLATEDGVQMYEMNYLRINSISGNTTYYTEGPLKDQIKTTSLDNFFKLMNAEADRQKAAKEPLRFPYKFLAVDTVDELEAMCDVSASAKFFKTSAGKGYLKENPDLKSVTELGFGYGYQYLRTEIMDKISMLKLYCRYLILISHVRDKTLDKGGLAVEYKDISLTGKLGQIVSAKCDLIGYLYREKGKPLMVSFETYENSTMGARFQRLAGKRIEMKWENIFLQE